MAIPPFLILVCEPKPNTRLNVCKMRLNESELGRTRRQRIRMEILTYFARVFDCVPRIHMLVVTFTNTQKGTMLGATKRASIYSTTRGINTPPNARGISVLLPNNYPSVPLYCSHPQQPGNILVGDKGDARPR